MMSDELVQMHWQNDLLSSLEVGIVVLNSDFHVEAWNQFMENHSDILPSKIIGKSLFSVFPEIDQQWLKNKADPVFNLNTPVFIIWEQRPYLFKFGSNRPITSDAAHMFQNVTMFPLNSPNGEVTRLCMLVYDVTDQALGKLRVDRLNDDLKIMSRTDGLTGLNNRRYWQERFDHIYKLTKRREKASTVVMLDIDHFKKVNDTHGHQAGDKVIQALAKVINRTIRDTDLAGRYGGEEFAIVLLDAAGEDAKMVAERIRTSAAKTTVEHEGVVIQFTISIGLSEYSSTHDSAMAWLECADQALYEAKESGRNRVVVHSLPTTGD